MVTPVLGGYGVALPRPVDQQQMWQDFFAGHCGGDDRAHRIFRHAGVDTRHFVADPRVDDVSHCSTAERMRRWLSAAVPLGETALVDALADAGIPAGDLGLLTVVSCTGYATPGLDLALAHRLDTAVDLQRTVIGHMGCYAAIPGLRGTADYVRHSGRPAALLCVELTSLHLQPAPLDTEQVVAHALFGDAAAAVIVTPDGPGPEIVDVTARTAIGHTRDMTWQVTDTGFRMTLSPRIPSVLARHLPDTVAGLLHRHGLHVDDIDGWAVHPGGRAVLDVTGTALGLDGTALAASREILRHHGNCSSPTVLMILRRLARQRRDNTVALAFGPGLTLYGALLRSR